MGHTDKEIADYIYAKHIRPLETKLAEARGSRVSGRLHADDQEPERGKSLCRGLCRGMESHRLARGREPTGFRSHRRRPGRKQSLTSGVFPGHGTERGRFREKRTKHGHWLQTCVRPGSFPAAGPFSQVDALTFKSCSFTASSSDGLRTIPSSARNTSPPRISALDEVP